MSDFNSYFLFISGQEIIVVFVIFLVLFGSKSIPGLARTMGRAMRQFKDASNEIQREMTDAAGDVRKQVQEHRKTLDQMGAEDAPAPKKTDTE